MIQDLSDLSVMGKANATLLEAINFDQTQLDMAAQAAHHLTDLRSDVNGEKVKYRQAKKIRDQAYTHLKEAVDQGYRYGRYVFWQDEAHQKHYRSAHLFSKRNRKPASDRSTTAAECESAAAGGNQTGGESVNTEETVVSGG